MMFCVSTKNLWNEEPRFKNAILNNSDLSGIYNMFGSIQESFTVATTDESMRESEQVRKANQKLVKMCNIM